MNFMLGSGRRSLIWQLDDDDGVSTQYTMTAILVRTDQSSSALIPRQWWLMSPLVWMAMGGRGTLVLYSGIEGVWAEMAKFPSELGWCCCDALGVTWSQECDALANRVHVAEAKRTSDGSLKRGHHVEAWWRKSEGRGLRGPHERLLGCAKGKESRPGWGSFNLIGKVSSLFVFFSFLFQVLNIQIQFQITFNSEFGVSNYN
jgi:hypothetical protein